MNYHFLKMFPGLPVLMAGFIFASCNNQASAPAVGKDSITKASTPTVTNWTQEDEQEFMGGCVDNAKTFLAEERAYSYCKCILAQVKTKYAMDSTIVSKLSDSTEIVRMAQNCK